MKRADLNVGDEVLYRRGKYDSGDKAVIVDTDPHATDNFSRTRPYYKSSKGTKVLVDLHVDWSNTPQRQAVPLATLIGPYEETKAAIEAERAAERKRDDAARAIEDAEQAETYRLIELSRSLGLAGVLGMPQLREPSAMMPTATLAVLLEAYAAKES